ncbi:MAG: outer membrane protein assembly factor BamA [Paracoccaceae bacterium]
MLRASVLAVLISTTAGYETFLMSAHAQEFSFSEVVIEGNQRVDDATILAFAGIGRDQTLTAGALNDAYQRLVAAGLFETVELVPQGGRLLIRVQEFPMLNVVDFEGNERLKDEALAEAIVSKSRLVYSPAQAEADAETLTELYRARGRIAATVEPRIIRRDDNRVDLVFEIAEGKVVEIERLSFVGNRAFSDRRLRQVLETKQAGLLRTLIQRDTYLPERIELDKQLLRDFYLSRGYIDFQVLDASAEVSRERDATFVAFTLQEGRSFTVGEVQTISEIEGLDVAAFDAVRKLRSGVTYSPQVIETNIARMETLAIQNGQNFVRVEPRIERNDLAGTVDVTFALVRGERVFVERIDIEGNTTTLDQVVRRQFRTVEGDPFNPREIRQAAERIRALGFFEDARIEAEPGAGPDQVVVNVDVLERPTGSISFGATYGTDNGLGFNVSYGETNFLGRGQQLSLVFQSGTSTRDSSFSFVEPALLGRDLKLKLSGAYRTSDSDFASYDIEEILLTPALDFPLTRSSRVELRLGARRDGILDVATVALDDPLTTDVDESNPGSSEILLREEGLLNTGSAGYSYSFDTSYGGLDPDTRFLFRFGQDVASAGGSEGYVESTLLALAETQVFAGEVTLRAIAEGGVVTGFGGYVPRATERYFGRGKIRGFEPNGIGPRDLTAGNEDALGGNMFAVARLEADFPLGLPEEYGMTGGAFLDVGSVWALGDTAGTGGPVDDALHPRAVAGLTLFWSTPLGPLRFNFSRALVKEDYDREQTFEFTISTKF